MKKLALSIFTALFLCSTANAQSVKQSGTVTPNHVSIWATNGVVKDGGTAAIPFASSFGVVGGQLCANSGPVTGPYNAFCLQATQTGGGVISIYNYAGATGGISFNYNGSTQGFPVVALPTLTNDTACFANTTGSLRDCSGSGAWPLNLVAYGADPSGANDSYPAWVAAVAALPPQGGSIYIPTGKYKFLTSPGYTFTTTPAAIKVYGAGPEATIVSFPSSYGFFFTYDGSLDSANVTDMTITTGAQGAGVGITLSQPVAANCAGIYSPSHVERVTFRGSDNVGIGGNDYWVYGVLVNGVSGFDGHDITVWGGVQTGVGVTIAGYTSGGGCQVTASSITNLLSDNNAYGVLIGTKVQGVQMSRLNITNAAIDGIQVQAGGTGLADISVTNSQFDVGQWDVNVLSGVEGIAVFGNYMSTTVSGGGGGVNIAVQQEGRIFGNYMFQPTPNSGVGVQIAGSGTWPTVVGTNNLYGFTTGVSLTSTAVGAIVNKQVCTSVTTCITDSGSDTIPTGTGSAVLNNGPTLIAPVLGTPASGVATNLTGTAAGLTAGNLSSTVWTATTPTPTCSAGVPTTITAAARTLHVGKTVFYTVTATLTTINTCTIGLLVPLGYAAGAGEYVGSGVNNATGANEVAVVSAGGSSVLIYLPTYVFPGVNGQTVAASGTYETN